MYKVYLQVIGFLKVLKLKTVALELFFQLHPLLVYFLILKSYHLKSESAKVELCRKYFFESRFCDFIIFCVVM